MRVYYYLLWFLLARSSVCQQNANTCAFFTFRKYPVVVKNSSATLSFMVNNTCRKGNVEIETVKVSLKKATRPYLLLCSIDFNDGLCDSSTGCECDRHTHTYSVQRSLGSSRTRPETLELTGTLKNGLNFERDFYLQATYPPEIIGIFTESNGELVERSGEVDKNVEIKITCIWSEGLPFTKAQMKRDGLEILTSEAPGTKHHGAHHSEFVIANTSCSDTAEFSCEAAGAKKNKTTSLIVKCAPQFDYKAPQYTYNAEETLLQFPVYVYNKDIMDCWILMYDQSTDYRQPINCGRTAVWSGKVPRLTLTFALRKMTPQVLGDWRLELSNRIGTGVLNFSIVADTEETQKDESTVGPKLEGTNASSAVNLQFFVLLGAIGCVFLLVIILAAIFWTLHKRRQIQAGGSFPHAPPAPHGARLQLPDNMALQDVLRALRADRPRRVPVNHIYSDIDDDKQQSNTDNGNLPAQKSPGTDGSGSSEFVPAVANASSDSTVSENSQHPLVCAPGIPGAPDDRTPPLASASGGDDVSDGYLRPVSSSPPTVDNTVASDKAVSDNYLHPASRPFPGSLQVTCL